MDIPGKSSHRGFDIRIARIDEIVKLNHIEQRASEMFAETEHSISVSLECLDRELLETQISKGLAWVAVNLFDEPVGFAVILELEKGKAHLHEISVLPEFGRRGIGRKLIGAICGWAK